MYKFWAQKKNEEENIIIYCHSPLNSLTIFVNLSNIPYISTISIFQFLLSLIKYLITLIDSILKYICGYQNIKLLYSTKYSYYHKEKVFKLCITLTLIIIVWSLLLFSHEFHLLLQAGGMVHCACISLLEP
ncbi:hypothetical protein DERP_008542 [Dermatophagoides pteronyssinus]|uniref:Uncharacterized protein n=1 Tax=Dermatophagoides pteronyssinus TaxID=6956 RepID=A0ABQ8IWY5_DERPT|nr:hypothetical protein DERP_008542 [Dermatophagoides pteronyssinus]